MEFCNVAAEIIPACDTSLCPVRSESSWPCHRPARLRRHQPHLVDHSALQAADVNEHGISHKLFPVKDKKNRETINPPAALRHRGIHPFSRCANAGGVACAIVGGHACAIVGGHACAIVGGHASQRDTCHAIATYVLPMRCCDAGNGYG